MTRPRGLASRAFPRLLFLLLLAAPSALSLDASFEFYPKAAQSCLSKAATSSACSGDTSKELNACLCSNGGQFVEKAIQCLAQENNDVMGDVFTTMDDACSTSGTPLSWKWSDWVDAAKSATSSSSSSSSTTTTLTETSTKTVTKTASTTATESTSTTLTTATASSTSSGSSSPSSIATATATNSPTSSPSPSPGDSSSNLSTTATIGIAAGVSVAGVAAIAALAFFLVRKRKRASQPPMSYSMLTPEKYNGAGGAGAVTSYPLHGPSPSNLGGGGGGGAAGGFDSEANETPLYTLPAYVSKSQSKQSYTALSGTSPDSALEQQKKQHNFLSGWEPPTHAPQYTGPYAPPQTGPVELPPQMQPVMSNVFELDAHGVGAAPRPAQPALQPIAERQRESRMYRPYMPT
ncbi:hypothetical protein MY8738_008430 [Beauveria namnaoensis]